MRCARRCAFWLLRTPLPRHRTQHCRSLLFARRARRGAHWFFGVACMAFTFRSGSRFLLAAVAAHNLRRLRTAAAARRAPRIIHFLRRALCILPYYPFSRRSLPISCRALLRAPRAWRARERIPVRLCNSCRTGYITRPLLAFWHALSAARWRFTRALPFSTPPLALRVSLRDKQRARLARARAYRHLCRPWRAPAVLRTTTAHFCRPYAFARAFCLALATPAVRAS